MLSEQLDKKAQLPIKDLESAIRDLDEGRNMVDHYYRLDWPDLVCPSCDRRYLAFFVPTVGYSGGFIDEEGDTRLFTHTCSCGCEFEQELVLQRIRHARGCWGLCSFGGKDADLDSEGCTGINNIVQADEKKVDIQVGGHKSIGDPTYESEFDLSEQDSEHYSALAHGIVSGCGFTGEWTGDDWCLSTQETISVDWVRDLESGNVDIAGTARAIVAAAHKALEGYEKEMKLMSDMMDDLYNEIRKKYDN